MVETIKSKSEHDTSQIARMLLDYLKPGDCLLLVGPVGVGKSFFARALIQAQMQRDGQTEDVPSPTFTLIQEYETSLGRFCHADLYRLGDPSELDELGLPSYFSDAICLIEWPEKLGSYRPERNLLVKMSLGRAVESREIEFLPSGEGWSWISQLADAYQRV